MVVEQLAKLDGMWGRFIPMSALFFLMAFVNTIIDSLKDSLVITAAGGGTEVLPYLSVYAVLPSSVLFLVAYSWGTRRFSRGTLFNLIIGVFLLFYVGFGLMYPHHEALHLSEWADGLGAILPSGLAGMVGMVRNWLFTLFYCASELWGDVVLSLLFWGLANETTSIEDAPLLYPLFGIGANLAQTLAGRSLRLISDAVGVHMSYTVQLQATIGLCVALGCCIIALHTYIAKTFPRNPKGSTAARVAAERAQAAREAEAAAAEAAAGRSNGANGAAMQRVKLDLEASVRGLNYCEVHPSGDGSAASYTSSSVSSIDKKVASSAAASTKTAKAMSLGEAFAFLRNSPQIRCLAVMALAQGITTRLLEVTFKHYLHRLYSTPAEYAAFLGDTAMWTGIVTGSLMLTSPAMFDRLGWRGVASATPTFMLWGGVPFFIGCIAYNFLAERALSAGMVTLYTLVIAGALMQVFSRGAKFSLFKPAEEMVYIGLDDESRTKGKAAIDVVGAQSGKSVGSILQQALLIITGGTVGGILPVLAVFYAVMLHQWNTSVADLAEHYDPAHVHRLSVMGSLDEGDADDGGSNGNGSSRGADDILGEPLPSPAAA